MIRFHASLDAFARACRVAMAFAVALGIVFALISAPARAGAAPLIAELSLTQQVDGTSTPADSDVSGLAQHSHCGCATGLALEPVAASFAIHIDAGRYDAAPRWVMHGRKTALIFKPPRTYAV